MRLQPNSLLKAHRQGEDVHLELSDPSEFERAMIVRARRGGSSISETVTFLVVSCATVSKVFGEYPV